MSRQQEEGLVTWLTGPTRTADIEKILVLGAQGPAEMTVVLLPPTTTGRVKTMPQTVPRRNFPPDAHLQELLQDHDTGLALIRQPADLYYYTGTVADGFLAVPAEGAPKFLVRRPQERLAGGDIPWDLAFYRDLGEIPGLLHDLGVARKGLWVWNWTCCPRPCTCAFRPNSFPGRPWWTSRP
jgi:hypothetical protein